MLLALRLILAAVFLVAGLAKLADRSGAQAAVVAFGAPERLARTSALALITAELLAALLLIAVPTVLAGAVLAAVLLAAFCVAIAAAMARGEAPDCHCFGQLHSAPAGKRTLARNGALLVVAIAIAAGAASREPASVLGWTQHTNGAEETSIFIAAVAVVIATAAVALAILLLRAHGKLLLRLDAIEGAAPFKPRPAPDFALPGLEGDVQTLDDLLETERPLVLVFSDAGCGPCRELAPELADWQTPETTCASPC
ncbi:MAG: hypothetical protein PGN13_00235 [Patulibacter minatonensis]